MFIFVSKAFQRETWEIVRAVNGNKNKGEGAIYSNRLDAEPAHASLFEDGAAPLSKQFSNIRSRRNTYTVYYNIYIPIFYILHPLRTTPL